LFASDFVAKRVSANVTGSGSIKCHATDFLKVRTSGSGSVGYKGNPELDYPKKGLYKL
ncbi:GIN domain-containing protein, partial [Bacteroides heparinolyticus]